MNITYKPLPSPYIKNGFEHTQLFRNGDFALFHKVHLDPHFDAGFEVVIITRHEGYELGGNMVEPAECFPSPEMWGIRGWTFQNLLAAKWKYNKLVTGNFVPESHLYPDAPAETESIVLPASGIVAPAVEADRIVKPNHSGRGRPRVALPVLTIPETEFSVKELAASNNVEYVIAYQFVKANPDKIKKTREERRAAKGPMTSLFAKA